MRYYVEAAEIGSVIKSRAYYNANKHEHVEHCLIFVADSYNKRSAAEHLEIVPKMRKRMANIASRNSTTEPWKIP